MGIRDGAPKQNLVGHHRTVERVWKQTCGDSNFHKRGGRMKTSLEPHQIHSPAANDQGAPTQSIPVVKMALACDAGSWFNFFFGSDDFNKIV